MKSLTGLREVVDVVIGVDAPCPTHSAAFVDTGTGDVLGEITVEATGQVNGQLVESPANTPRCEPGRSKGPVVMAPA